MTTTAHWSIGRHLDAKIKDLLNRDEWGHSFGPDEDKECSCGALMDWKNGVWSCKKCGHVEEEM